jgi:uncharacterized protein (TIGR00159 family)
MWPGRVYFTDSLDILIIALFLYSLLLLLRRTRYFMMFLGLSIAAGLYLLSQILHLELTLRVLHYFGGVALVVLVIIFQTEIRKYFEFLGLIGSRQIKVGPWVPRSPSTAEIVQAMVKMAQAKIGALIVIQGRDAIDTYISGGIELDGLISEEILCSIFYPHSAGHDGAVVISNNRIQRFATQLPLSVNFREIGKRGTRHSAALGLSESTDALCLVVSEETGSISVCRNAHLKTLDNFSDLEKEVDKFTQVKFSSQPENPITHLIRHNFWLKLTAVVSAAVIWLVSVYHSA